ncbi:nitroreductase family protein [Streptomyces albidus (ex Kaewkla and Franco 2022)]|uniref:nitroreductase family protein n=1 Tax=Streptomyces albidus (ex Kaewkla and Franco 2022) TaxID=722709 RepID=UPI0015EF148D|nr:nitroreductase family protein [Streptomyces albidus (ex Kaewkla and Franco 2022)]
MGYAHDYADAIKHRARVPMEPADFVPDWADRPRKGKYYPGVESFPLPRTDFPEGASAASGCLPGEQPPADGRFTLPLLSGMLQDSYGLVGRRLGVQANTDLAALPHYTQTNWSRGTASGGGLYPVSVYWASGPSGPLTPGVHYYANHRHAMQRLLTGDVTGEIREAVGCGQSGPDTDQFLILGIKYWQNAFKYNSFSFHVVSMDIGTILQSWRMWARSRGLRVEPAMWFDEPRLNRLLGTAEEEEGVFAVVPLSWEDPEQAEDAPRPASGPEAASTPRVGHADVELSRRVLDFGILESVRAATAENSEARPGPEALADAVALPLPDTRDALPLPPPQVEPLTMREALRGRRSSFGRFDATRPISAAQLGTALAASAAVSLETDAEPPGGSRLVKLYAFVNHVEGIDQGAYEYDPEAHALRPVVDGPHGEFLQRNYFLANYNLEQSGAVLVPSVRTTAVLDAVGDRGYRLYGATTGAVSQAFYAVCTALGLGAGVALGFDNVSYIEQLSLERTGETPLLIMLLGHERPQPADFRYEIA